MVNKYLNVYIFVYLFPFVVCRGDIKADVRKEKTNVEV